jgi:hypothetical protein
MPPPNGDEKEPSVAFWKLLELITLLGIELQELTQDVLKKKKGKEMF